MSQIQVAEVLEVHPVTVNKWERGKRPVGRVVELALRGLLCEREHQAVQAAPAAEDWRT